VNLIYTGNRHNRTASVNRRFVLAVGLREKLFKQAVHNHQPTILFILVPVLYEQPMKNPLALTKTVSVNVIVRGTFAMTNILLY
jgi:hypothetical protein